MGIHREGWDFFYLKLKKLSQTAQNTLLSQNSLMRQLKLFSNCGNNTLKINLTQRHCGATRLALLVFLLLSFSGFSFCRKCNYEKIK